MIPHPVSGRIWKATVVEEEVATGIMVLTGEASRRLWLSLYRPTPQEVEERRRIGERIDREVKISLPDSDGSYNAEVEWLDLSFLDRLDRGEE